MVFQGLFQMGHHIVIDGQMLLKVFVIFPVNRLIVLFDMGTGRFGIIGSGDGTDLGIGDNEYARLKVKLIIAAQGKRLLMKMDKPLPHIWHPGHNGKLYGGTARNQGIGKSLMDQGRKLP